ncbi:MAG: bifunctional phosphopantothenoylcysteine decarboxylase/phosphopantothenate--cysteine ligase CoaBC [Candidatus Latescibacteria bacterium]|nr:bifunctional phosphopantothenoylcysteine decarboxylase/phosphopantothenate--cysteine ligase CoaBC [Candidatus Latescibacterota bacterium]
MDTEKNIVVGVTGGIAAYKAAELVRALKKREAEVKVVMTEAATRFISPLTMETLSGHAVAVTLFPPNKKVGVRHISLAEWASLIVVAPATANFLGKAASGIADDLLSTVVMAAGGPVLFAPAMNDRMWTNPIVQNNVRTLQDAGVHVVEPEEGVLASGKIGVGRLAGIERIVEAVECVLDRSEALCGKKILITASRTEEDVDPVRFLTNRSTGKMGYALARVAQRRGAQVVLVSGPTHLSPPENVEWVRVRTAEQMRRAVIERFETCDALVMAAAVANFRPQVFSDQKIKKGGKAWALKLERTADILSELAPVKRDKVMVGFAVETENPITHAREKLQKKNLDFIVINNPLVEGAAFGTDTNVVTMLDRKGGTEELPKMSKHKVAEKIMERVESLIGNRAS